jgi:hypothetical protein
MESHSGLRRSYLTGSGAAQGDLWGLSNFAMLLSGVIERLKSAVLSTELERGQSGSRVIHSELHKNAEGGKKRRFCFGYTQSRRAPEHISETIQTYLRLNEALAIEFKGYHRARMLKFLLSTSTER